MAEKQCFLMLCRNETEEECLERNLFGDQEWRLPLLRQIKKDDVGFLINLSKNQLIGIFEARAPAQLNIEPDAWNRKFPAQVRVRALGAVQRVSGAIEKLQSAGVGMTTIASGATVPKFPVHTPAVLDKVLAFFSQPPAPPAPPTPPTRIERQVELPAFSDKLKFENIAGLKNIKQFIRERMIEPAIDSELAAKFRLRLGGGLLLYGPPGTGKTLIAQATAGELDAEFVEISPSVIRGFPGDAEKKIEELFQKLLNFPRAVVFLDEAEALLAQRENQTSSVMERITPVLLAQFSKIFKNRYKPVLIIAATNAPWKIDRAFLRPGRFDKALYVGPPDLKARIDLLRLSLKDRPISGELTEDRVLSEIASMLEGHTGADIEQIADQAALETFRQMIDTKSETVIAKERLVEICRSWPKSVNEKVVSQFTDWGRQFGHIN